MRVMCTNEKMLRERTAMSDPASAERIVVVDVLRAFALFGIIVTHAAAGFLAGPAPDPEFMTFSPLDRTVGKLETLFSFGKFYTLFSFLFGLSFAIQLHNAARKGAVFAGRFTWRLTILLVIGFVHGLFFSGDVLIVYALLGLLLIPCRNLGNRSLLIIASILVLNIPTLLFGLAQVSSPPSEDAATQMQAFMQLAQRQFDLKQSGSLPEVMSLNATFGMLSKLIFLVFSGRLWITFGLFLLGLYAGRMQIFYDTPLNRQRFRRVFVWGGAVALATTVIAAVRPAGMQIASLTDVLASAFFSIQHVALSSFYVAAITLLFWARPSGALSALAPLGKMGLTTYLTQSAFGLIVFYGFGFGLLGKIGVAAAVGLAIAFYGLQILVSYWWLRRFSMGPFEWLWRSLTYLRLQPSARDSTSSA
jgi:uncharacterized protein